MEGKRKFLGITCPPDRVPQTPAGALRPLLPVPRTGFPRFMGVFQGAFVHVCMKLASASPISYKHVLQNGEGWCQATSDAVSGAVKWISRALLTKRATVAS
jgi:hypothetical protein